MMDASWRTFTKRMEKDHPALRPVHVVIRYSSLSQRKAILSCARAQRVPRYPFTSTQQDFIYDKLSDDLESLLAIPDH